MFPFPEVVEPDISTLSPVYQEQYVFIHDALAEAILSRDTLVTSELLHTYVSGLLTPGPTGRMRMDKQLKVFNGLTAPHPG